ncbi:LCP family protein [Lentibacillus cibarius]|uniref:LytR family transcriptional regulator n=1 Tax=Lentibacillus cibarius TaxID=2583219 RepID=A0A5S3QIX0_9BACI|nr:LCP family protein [Lentibacillus cibarius]TMN21768.1 LytR family transcriptional regulator [Lentibacillus cibarius]
MTNNTSQTRRVRRQKKRRLRKKRVFFVFVPLLVVFVTVIYATYLYVEAKSILSESHEDDGREKSDLRDKVVDPSEDNVTILIAGVDASDVRNNSNGARTDTLMLATLNKDEKSVRLLSIPRDSYVYIPEVGYKTKINHAHAFGGIPATIETVENLMDIPVDYYAKLNFEAFIDVVNALNGITVNVPYELYEQNSKDVAGAIHLQPGEQKLNGEEALALARTRKLDNDIERGKRQQKIIQAVVDKTTSIGSITKITDIMEAVGSNLTTNMKFDEMKSFVSYGLKGSSIDFKTMTLQGSDNWTNSGYYWQLDQTALMETKQKLKEHLELIDKTEDEAVQESSGETGTQNESY